MAFLILPSWYSQYCKNLVFSLGCLPHQSPSHRDVNIVKPAHSSNMSTRHHQLWRNTVWNHYNAVNYLIIWTNAGVLSIGPLGINLNEIYQNSYIFIQENVFENVVWEMAAISCRPQCVNWNTVKRTVIGWFYMICGQCIVFNRAIIGFYDCSLLYLKRQH